MKRNLKTKLLLTAVVAAIGLLPACKPTEKNYKSAYDAAQAKRKEVEEEQMLPSTGLVTMDGPRLRVVDGDSVYVSSERVKVADGETGELKAFNVGTAFFKMKTNAAGAAGFLRDDGYRAFAAQSAKERWYVIAGCFDTLSEAVAFYKEFVKKNPDYNYIGLPDAPVILRR